MRHPILTAVLLCIAASSESCLAAAAGQYVVASLYYEGDVGQSIDNSGVTPHVILTTTRRQVPLFTIPSRPILVTRKQVTVL